MVTFPCRSVSIVVTDALSQCCQIYFRRLQSPCPLYLATKCWHFIYISVLFQIPPGRHGGWEGDIHSGRAKQWDTGTAIYCTGLSCTYSVQVTSLLSSNRRRLGAGLLAAGGLVVLATVLAVNLASKPSREVSCWRVWQCRVPRPLSHNLSYQLQLMPPR